MTEFEKFVVLALCRLFWLITQQRGVARYASDVRFFTDAEKLVSPERAQDLERLAKGYEDAERTNESDVRGATRRVPSSRGD